jgi:hypothetical protein
MCINNQKTGAIAVRSFPRTQLSALVMPDYFCGELAEKANGSKSKSITAQRTSGVRRQFLSRMVSFADRVSLPIQFWYYLLFTTIRTIPSNVVGGFWNHTGMGLSSLIDAETMRRWAQNMIYKGIYPVINWSNQGLPERPFSIQNDHEEG